MLFGARQKRLLGIVVGEHSVLVAESSSDLPAAAPTGAVEFPFPDQLTIDQPAPLGALFSEFLSRNGMTATDVVIGVPARQLVCRPVTIPPTDPRTAAQLLWLQTATQFSEDLGTLVFDFAGETSRDRATTVNLIGLQQTYLDRLLAFAAAAGLKPIAVNVTIAALAAATAGHVNDAICLSVRCDGAELALGDGSSTPLFKHLAATTAVPRLITELRRTAFANSAAADAPASDRTRRKLVLWDDVGLDGDAAKIAAAIGMKVVPGERGWLGGAPAASGACAPLALLSAARNGQRLSPDFLHPRITPHSGRALSRPVMAIGGAVAALLIVALVAYADILHIEGQIAATRQQVDALAPQLETARPFASQMQYVKTFQPGESNYLKCLKDLTLSIPQEGQTYLTSFVLDSGMKGACIGHSGSEQDVLDLLDKLNATGRFAGLGRKLDTKPKGNLSDVVFTLTFTYDPSGVKPG